MGDALERIAFKQRSGLVTIMSIWLNSSDAQLVRKHAALQGKSISNFTHDVVFERIEDQEDVAALRNVIAEDDGVRYTHAQVLDELGL